MTNEQLKQQMMKKFCRTPNSALLNHQLADLFEEEDDQVKAATHRALAEKRAAIIDDPRSMISRECRYDVLWAWMCELRERPTIHSILSDMLDPNIVPALSQDEQLYARRLKPYPALYREDYFGSVSEALTRLYELTAEKLSEVVQATPSAVDAG